MKLALYLIVLVQLELEKEEKEAAGRERRLVECALEAEQVRRKHTM